MLGGQLARWLAVGALGTAFAGNERLCIKNTGGTCNTEACASWRGSTYCDHGTINARCFCANSGCAGTDEKCYDASSPYTQLDSGRVYKIRNARWPEQYLWVREDGAVLTSTDSSSAKSQFTVVVPPYPGTIPAYLLYSQQWQDSTVVVAPGDKQKVAKCERVTGGLFGLAADPTISAIALRFTLAPLTGPNPNVTLVMLSGYSYTDRYIYLPAVSLAAGGWAVDVQQNDPGAGGYWVFEPPLPAAVVSTLQTYTGPRCSWSCGDVSSAAGLRATMWRAAAAILVAAAALVA